MIPFRDDNPTRTFPIVVVLLLAFNTLVFLYQVALPRKQELIFVYTHAVIPAVLFGRATLGQVVGVALPPLEPVWLTVFTSMFLHGSLFHLGSNMLYLWIFGNNVEDALGHFRFLVFYLLCGLIAALAQVLVNTRSAVPMVGASGAIAGVLGAYYVKFPYARVRCLVILFVFITVVMLPASLVLLIWFLIQVYNSLLPTAYGTQGGVAFFAHIGGFLAGWALVRRFEPRRRRIRFIQ
jgi:membrane associated rhomboid family serine protease